MQSLCLTICRFALAAWVGAAGLFVVTSVHEQRSPAFDSTIREQLALIRFPAYYLFGFSLVGAAAVSGTIAVRHPAVSWKRMLACLALIAAALAAMTVDYFAVYRPLAEAISPPGEKARDATFKSYHTASRRINELHVTLCFLAAVTVCWPGRARV